MYSISWQIKHTMIFTVFYYLDCTIIYWFSWFWLCIEFIITHMLTSAIFYLEKYAYHGYLIIYLVDCYKLWHLIVFVFSHTTGIICTFFIINMFNTLSFECENICFPETSSVVPTFKWWLGFRNNNIIFWIRVCNISSWWWSECFKFSHV